jgi:hypothetical protein
MYSKSLDTVALSKSERYTVKTSVGKFRVEKSKDHLKIGGAKFCVEIKCNDVNSEESELQWLITKDGGCELDDKPIQGNSTVHLLYLSFTLLKTYGRTRYIHLLDNSKFDCEFEDGTKTTVFMNKYNYLFHGGTWYDTKTNAIPLDPTQKELYTETKSLYTDPSVKKQGFDFRNPLLQAELTPLYEAATTWKEFAEALHAKYNRADLCRKIAPWYSYAVAIFTKNRMLPEYWKIDITELPPIPFTRLSSGGGKIRKRNYILPSQDYTLLSPSELYSKRI